MTRVPGEGPCPGLRIAAFQLCLHKAEGQTQSKLSGVYSYKASNSYSFFFFKLINLFIFGCVGSSFLCEGFL